MGKILENLNMVLLIGLVAAIGLMMGFHAEAESLDFEVNQDELASALWLSREELRPENLPKDGSFFMPRRDSIARRLIEEWLGHETGPSISG